MLRSQSPIPRKLYPGEHVEVAGVSLQDTFAHMKPPVAMACTACLPSWPPGLRACFAPAASAPSTACPRPRPRPRPRSRSRSRSRFAPLAWPRRCRKQGPDRSFWGSARLSLPTHLPPYGLTSCLRL
eukprot:6181797-Pleurochrysis_carterae.AAC.1